MKVIILGCGYLGYNLYGLLKDRFDVALWGIESPYTPLVHDQVMINAFDKNAMATMDLTDAVVIDAIGLIANNARSENEQEALEQIRKPYLDLIDALKDGHAKRFVYFSSGGTVYGDSEQPIAEMDPTNPKSLYAKSKLMSEQLIKESGMSYLILRLSNPYGGYQIAEKKQGVIPILIRKAYLREPFEMYIDASSRRDYFYITDLAEAIGGLLEKDVNNETVNVGSGIATSLSEIIHLVEEETGRTIMIHLAEAEMPTVQSIVLDITKLKQLTGYVPSVGLVEGIRRENLRIKKELGL